MRSPRRSDCSIESKITFTSSSARPLGIFCTSHNTSMRSDFVIVSSSPGKGKNVSKYGTLSCRALAITKRLGRLVFPEHGPERIGDLAQGRPGLDGAQD